jgi:hypothetical protein
MSRKLFLLLFGLVLVLRIALAAGFRGNIDTQSYLIAVAAVESGQNVYQFTDRYNYTPVWAYVLTGLWRLASPNVGLFLVAIGLLLTAADVVTTALVVRVSKRRLGRSEPEALRHGLLFFSNPVSVLISCCHGQFDGLSILFLLAALAAAASPGPRRSARVAAWLSASLLVKHVTIFHPLLFSRRRSDGVLSDRMVAAPYAVFALAFVPFLGAWRSIWENAVVYGGRVQGLKMPGGVSAVLYATPWIERWIWSAILLAGVAWVLWLTPRLELTRACLVLFLALLTLSPSHAVQYWVWPAALGALFPSAAYGLFTLCAALYHSSAPESLAIDWPLRPSAAGVWAAAAGWLAWELVLARRSRVSPEADWAAGERDAES